MLALETNSAAHMDAIYRYQRHVYDASRKFYLLGRDKLLDELRPPDRGSILEIACGTGRNLVLASRLYPRARLYGFDVSRAMLATAEASIVRAGLAPRIRVALCDATTFSGTDLFGVEHFDRAFISYALSMIAPWRQSLRAALASVKPGGSLHVVDFGQQSDLPRWFGAGLRAWLAAFSVEPRPDLESELVALARDGGAMLRFESLYRDYARYAVLAKT